MVVKNKIEKKDEIGDVDEYLSKGGTVRADMIKEADITEWKTVCLRIPTDILQVVDQMVKERAALTRTAWILEAIQKYIKSEGKNE